MNFLIKKIHNNFWTDIGKVLLQKVLNDDKEK